MSELQIRVLLEVGCAGLKRHQTASCKRECNRQGYCMSSGTMHSNDKSNATRKITPLKSVQTVSYQTVMASFDGARSVHHQGSIVAVVMPSQMELLHNSALSREGTAGDRFRQHRMGSCPRRQECSRLLEPKIAILPIQLQRTFSNPHGLKVLRETNRGQVPSYTER